MIVNHDCYIQRVEDNGEIYKILIHIDSNHQLFITRVINQIIRNPVQEHFLNINTVCVGEDTDIGIFYMHYVSNVKLRKEIKKRRIVTVQIDDGYCIIGKEKLSLSNIETMIDIYCGNIANAILKKIKP